LRPTIYRFQGQPSLLINTIALKWLPNHDMSGATCTDNTDYSKTE